MAEYYFKQFQDYLRILCVEHIELAHDDISNRVFIRMFSEEDIMSIPHSAGTSLVYVDRYYGRAVGAIEENRLQQYVNILFITFAPLNDGDPYSGVESALSKSFLIMLDFFARMKQDQYEDSCGPLRHLDAEAMSYEEIQGPILERHFGWGMTIPFKSTAPAYNAAKWNRP